MRVKQGNGEEGRQSGKLECIARSLEHPSGGSGEEVEPELAQDAKAEIQRQVWRSLSLRCYRTSSSVAGHLSEKYVEKAKSSFIMWYF